MPPSPYTLYRKCYHLKIFVKASDVFRLLFANKKLIAHFHLQLVASRERLAMLEKNLEDPSDENRVRLLGGEDPEPEVLAKKIEELELRLAEKEEKLLEKDLIFEEVTRLADRTKKKSETGKEDTLELAKKVCFQCSSIIKIRLPIERSGFHRWPVRVILFCSSARHFSLTPFLATQKYINRYRRT